jgi:hypothetical protein
MENGVAHNSKIFKEKFAPQKDDLLENLRSSRRSVRLMDH